jgi:dihydroflavonol-4-reductase
VKQRQSLTLGVSPRKKTKTMKVIVTGANGFIGSHIVKKLLQASYQVRALVRPTSDLRSLENLDVELAYGDILDPDSLQKAFQGCRWCFHVAGVFSYWGQKSKDLVEKATEGMTNVMEAAAACQVEQIILTSSSVTRGASPGKRVINETTTEVAGHFLPYAESKRQQLQLAFRLAAEKELDVRAVGPTLTVGPHDYKLSESNRMIVNYLKDPLKSSWIGGCNIVAVEDIAQAHLLVAEKGKAGQFYLAGADNQEWETVHRHISELCGLPGPYMKAYHTSAYLAAWTQELWSTISGEAPLSTREQAKMVGQYYWYDSTRLKKMGYAPVSSRQALARAISWLVSSEHVPAAVRSTIHLSNEIYEIRKQVWNSKPSA